MWLRLAAMAALSVVLCESALAQARNVLTLDDAFARVADSHPDLQPRAQPAAGAVAEPDGNAFAAAQIGATTGFMTGRGPVH